MARWWVGTALVTGWLGAGAPAGAQAPSAAAPPAAVAQPAPFTPPGVPGTPDPVPTYGVPPDAAGLQTGAVVPPDAGLPPGVPVPPQPSGPVPGDNAFGPPFPPSDASNAFTECPQPCDVSQHIHLEFDYLRWFVQKRRVPLLATTGSVNDAVPGALGQPGTRILIDDVPGSTGHSGFRFAAGYDIGEAHVWGVESSFFALEQNTASVRVGGNGSAGSQVITRPFFNVVSATEDADPVNLPGVMSGTLGVRMPQRLFGADANVRYRLIDSQLTGYHFVLLAGARYMALDEKMLIDENLADVPGSNNPGNRFLLSENFTAYNRFYGGQLGTDFGFNVGPFTIQGITKVAFGSSEQSVRISGATEVFLPDGNIATNPQAALLVGPGNVGRHTHNVFAVVPEGQLNVSLAFNQNVALTVGYDALYWSRVARPGDQTSRGVNVQPVGAPSPVAPLEPGFGQVRSTGLWVQGLSVGLELTF